MTAPTSTLTHFHVPARVALTVDERVALAVAQGVLRHLAETGWGDAVTLTEVADRVEAVFDRATAAAAIVTVVDNPSPSVDAGRITETTRG